MMRLTPRNRKFRIGSICSIDEKETKAVSRSADLRRVVGDVAAGRYDERGT